MIDLSPNSETIGLLVSVRDADEAIAALEAGADIIDVKEPNRGSLGAADFATIAAIVKAVAGRAPVSAAIGELLDGCALQIPPGVEFVKIGLAGCGGVLDWQSRWRVAIEAIRQCDDSRPQPVAVVYADWRAAYAPNPADVLREAAKIGCPGLLIDTCDKSAGGLFDHWPTDRLHDFLNLSRAQLGFVVLAGSLAGESFRQAARLWPNLVAVRGAACDTGREGQMSGRHVRELKDVLRQVSAERDARRSFSASKLLNARGSVRFP
jgi:uncharacterized protein (UPF0264 family)